MSTRQKPKTQREMVDQLWDETIGTNRDGLVERVDLQTIAINNLTAVVAGLSGKLEGHMETARPSRKQINWQRIREVAVISLVLGAVLGGAFLLWLGVIVPDDIREIINAWRGS